MRCLLIFFRNHKTSLRSICEIKTKFANHGCLPLRGVPERRRRRDSAIPRAQIHSFHQFAGAVS